MVLQGAGGARGAAHGIGGRRVRVELRRGQERQP